MITADEFADALSQARKASETAYGNVMVALAYAKQADGDYADHLVESLRTMGEEFNDAIAKLGIWADTQRALHDA